MDYFPCYIARRQKKQTRLTRMKSTSSLKSNEVMLDGFPWSWEGYFSHVKQLPSIFLLLKFSRRQGCTEQFTPETSKTTQCHGRAPSALCSDELSGLRISPPLHHTSGAGGGGGAPTLLEELQNPRGSSSHLQESKFTHLHALWKTISQTKNVTLRVDHSVLKQTQFPLALQDFPSRKISPSC